MIFRLRTTSVLAALAATVSGPALAGGLSEQINEQVVVPVEVTAPEPADWTGFYVGGSIGNGEMSLENVDPDFEEEVRGFTADVENLFGIHAGYMRDLGSFVLGVEGEYLQGTVTAEEQEEDTDITILRAKGRVGYDMGQLLPYAVGGYAVLDPVDAPEDFDPLTGAFYGLGIDYAVTDSILIGGEYLIHNLSNDDVPADYEVTTMALRVSYKF